MPRVIFRDSSGVARTVEVAVGHTLMEGALEHGVKGVLAECGGACACATCHAYVGEQWLARLPPMEDMEDAMLDAAVARRPNSRLTFQLEMSAQLDGIELTVAPNEV
jgi:ferredoxin, 2Fe-2S